MQLDAPTRLSTAAPADETTRIGSLRLGDLDTGWSAAVPESQRAIAERIVLAARHRLPAGVWKPSALNAGADPQASPVLVLAGTLVRDQALAGRKSAILYGPGDLVHPWREDPLQPIATGWTVGAGGADIAVFDERFDLVCRKWPGLAGAVRLRLMEQLDASAHRLAILSLPRTDQRVLGLLWHFAERWGTVTPDGVVLRLQLTHTVIGRLVASQRPTVSLAVQALRDCGAAVATEGGWILAHGSDRLLEEPAASGTRDYEGARSALDGPS